MNTQTIAFADLRRSSPTLPDPGQPQAPAPTSSEMTAKAKAKDKEKGVGEPYRLHRRFDRMGRLLGDDGMSRLFRSHVVVVGIGGVGSWAAESLARSGVGRISLVDFDLVCVTNANRQLHALKGTTGKPKVEVMAERLRLVNPTCEVIAVREFYNEDSSDRILAPAGSDPPDLVIDAIDNLAAKTHLIATCRARGIPLIISGGASGRLDPTKIRESDLTKVQADPFIAATRKILRRSHDFPKGDGDWGLRTIHSTERPAAPRVLAYDDGGFQCVCPQGQNSPHSCEHRSVIYGTASFVTGAFGLACAAAAVRTLLASPQANAG